MADRDEELLVYQYRSRQLPRREFLRRCLAVGLSLSAAQALAIACAPSPAPTPKAAPTAAQLAAAAATSAPAATGPIRGGTLRVSRPDPPVSKQPLLSKTTSERILYATCYDYLVNIDDKYQLAPGLAESWDSPDGGTTWRFKLRTGVKFHHGTPFTADDVLFTYKLVMDPKFGCPVRSSFDKLEGVEKVDDYTVLFHWKSVFVDCPYYVTFYQLVILPHDIPADHDHFKQSVGTGPFKLKEFAAGEYNLVVRNDDYWGKAQGYPFLDAIRTVYIPQSETQVTALQAGQIDIMNEIAPALCPAVALSPNLVVETAPSGSYQPIKMRCDQKPFDDVRVRQAMKWVVDRQMMLKATVGNYGVIGNDHPIGACFPIYTELPTRPRDIEKAKALLAEAGFPKGIIVELNAPAGRPPIVEQALAFQEMAKAAGIQVNIVTKPWEVFVGGDDEMNVACGITNWSSRSHPSQILNAHYRCTSAWNIQRFCDQDYERLVDQSDGELNFDKRKALYKQIEELFYEKGPVVVSYFKNEQAALNKRVRGYKQHPLVQSNLWHQIWLSQT